MIKHFSVSNLIILAHGFIFLLCVVSFSGFLLLLLLQGGKFVLTVKGEDLGQLDEWWLHAVLAAIGETLEVRSLAWLGHPLWLLPIAMHDCSIVTTLEQPRKAFKLKNKRKHAITAES